MAQENILYWAAAVIALGGASGVIWRLFRPVVQKTRTAMHAVDQFLRDWAGEEEAPGRDRVPGVMERLNRIDGELQHNSGSSMKDSLKRIEQTLKKINERLDEGNKRFEEIESRLK
jgi:hypothetical protein